MKIVENEINLVEASINAVEHNIKFNIDFLNGVKEKSNIRENQNTVIYLNNNLIEEEFVLENDCSLLLIDNKELHNDELSGYIFMLPEVYKGNFDPMTMKVTFTQEESILIKDYIKFNI